MNSYFPRYLQHKKGSIDINYLFYSGVLFLYRISMQSILTECHSVDTARYSNAGEFVLTLDKMFVHRALLWRLSFHTLQ